MIAVMHFIANDAGRDFVVSDIHGCVAEFRALLEKVAFKPDVDRVFSVGDLVDRGPDSMGALRLLNEPWFHAVMGNHELMMIDALTDGRNSFAMSQWFANGGVWYLSHTGDELDELVSRASELPMAIVVGAGPRRFNVVHAEFFGTDDELAAGQFDDMQVVRMLWGRDLVKRPELAEHTPESVTYVGHTIVDAPKRIGSHLYIDTGAFRPGYIGEPGRMTLVDVGAGEFLQFIPLEGKL